MTIAALPAAQRALIFDVPVSPEERTFTIRRHPRNPADDTPGSDEYPWYVAETTWGDDRDDYGRMESHAAAVELVADMLRRGPVEP